MPLSPVEAILAKVTTDERTPLFLDFDGTLVEFADRPEDVCLPDSVRLTIARLLELYLPVTIVSGRDLISLRAMFPADLVDCGLSLIGCHGAETLGPVDSLRSTARMQAANETLNNLYFNLSVESGLMEGFWIEKKRYSLCLHYREGHSTTLASAAETVEIALRRVDERGLLRTIVSKRSVEVLPRWCGKAQAIKNKLSDYDNKLGLPLIIGDDEADEEAFRAFRRTAITVRVGSVSARTAADHHLQSPAQVLRLLDALAGAC